MILEIFGFIGLFYVIFRFLTKLNKTIPVFEILLVTAFIQWFLAPWMEYNNPDPHFKYFMYVDKKSYFNLIVPSLWAMLIPYSFFAKKRQDFKNLKYFDNIRLFNYGILLIGSGFLGELMLPFVPSSLKFIFYLISNLKYIGAILTLIYGKSTLIFHFVYSILVFKSFQSGYFHELIIWTIFFLPFYSKRKKISVIQKPMILIIGTLFLIFIQNIKNTYRSNLNEIGIIENIQISSKGLDKKSVVNYDVLTRLNQGWIISAVIENVDNKNIRLNGSSIFYAIQASFLPRFLMPNKSGAGGQQNFRLLSGLEIDDKTSMGVSLVGELYANFGLIGTIISFFLFSLLLNLFLNKLFRISKKNILVLFFIPLIFFQVVKAETELVVILNHLVKASILSALIIYTINRLKLDKKIIFKNH